ncbi:hypothetical protein CLV81_3018 [Flagellimonas meridianipacifica]|uniref:Uncharacterized protein n=1 Tax=Flagellimonas meridianipacifica TaxID=1080225 RepID=A0A2T0MAT2_9FLAO|nr:hypothetical protein CLV81_3018 [Allomuricauda pacifica]
MYILEFIILELLMVYWIYRIVKYGQPKKERPNSYNVFIGSLGTATMMIFVLIWFVVNKKSFFTELWNSLFK